MMQCRTTQAEARGHVFGKSLLRENHFRSEMEESSILQNDLSLEWKRIPELGGLGGGCYNPLAMLKYQPVKKKKKKSM